MFQRFDRTLRTCPLIDSKKLRNYGASAEVLRQDQTTTVFPAEELIYSLKSDLKNKKKIFLKPRQVALEMGMQPCITKVKKDGTLRILNNTDHIWLLKKHVHLADLREAISHKEALISKLYTCDRAELENYRPRQGDPTLKDFTQDVVLDPDGVLSQESKNAFGQLCEQYTDIIQYDPGTYNGAFGHVKNSLELTEIPPPNGKCYVPRYSKDQMNLLAEKMDELMDLKILVPPEKIGVTPIFTSPSMLVPKPKPDGGWRFVTDFTQLNNYIRKMPTLSPNIEDTKLQIAGFKFIACIDLSQFYFQNTVDRHSSQYLGVIHPFKGTLVYTVSPMGLRNSSELAYERLTRIFGDMQKDGRLCRQADALIVGGGTVDELRKNWFSSG